jgi:hypothetical protein
MATPPVITIAAVNSNDFLALANSRPKDWSRLMQCGISAVDIRVALPYRGPSASDYRLAALVRDAGLEVRCHGWAGVSNGTAAEISKANRASGEEQGKRAAANAALLGAARYGCNAEHHVWRGPNGTANPKAVDFLSGFLDTFYAENRDAHCDYLGYPAPEYHYRPIDADGDGDIDTEIPEEERVRWSRCAVMAYQTRPAAVLASIERAAKRWPEHELEAWVGVGRIDRTVGQVGSEEATKAAVRRCGRVTLYVGFGAQGQLLDGHSGHRALVAFVPELVAIGREVKA